MSQMSCMLNELVQLRSNHKRGETILHCQSPYSCWATCKFLKKISLFNPVWITFLTFLQPSLLLDGKTSHLSPQVEKIPLLKESVSTEAEGTAKVAWSVVKPNTTSTPPVELQNPSNSFDVACRSEVKQGKNYEKKTEEKGKEASEGSGWYDTC